MQDPSADTGFDWAALVVWAALLVTGSLAWIFSGTSLVGACIVLAILLSVASPAGALYATCAAIPLVYHPIEVGSMLLGMLELGIVITLTGTAIRILFDFVEKRRLPVLAWGVPSAVWMFPLLLFIVGTCSLMWMPFDSHRAEAFRTWRWVILEPLIVFLLARMTIRRHGGGPLTIAIVLPAGAISLFAIWQFGTTSSGFSADGVHRSTATYLHPNNLALYLERAAILALVPCLLFRSRARWLFAGLAGVLLAGLATTFSRGVLLGLPAGIAVVLVAHPVRRGWRILGAGAIAAVLTFVVFAGTRFAGADSSGFLATRMQLWKGAIAMLRDFPISGIGLDQFLWLNQSRYIDPRIWSERYSSHPHNLWLDSWLSLGVAGLTLLMCFTAIGGLIVWRSRSGSLTLSPWQLGALGCLGIGLGHGLVDNGYFLADLAVMTWLTVALLEGSTSIERAIEDA